MFDGMMEKLGLRAGKAKPGDGAKDQPMMDKPVPRTPVGPLKGPKVQKRDYTLYKAEAEAMGDTVDDEETWAKKR